MGVLAEAISVMVPISVLDEKYPGGRAQYVKNVPNETYCCDNHLTRVGFMAPDDVQEFVGRLTARGLRHIVDGKAVDLLVVDQSRGSTVPCEWLGFVVHADGFGIAWILGTPAQPMYAPDWWRSGNTAMLEFVVKDKVSERLIPLARASNMETHLNFKTGRETHIARTWPQPNSTTEEE